MKNANVNMSELKSIMSLQVCVCAIQSCVYCWSLFVNRLAVGIIFCCHDSCRTRHKTATDSQRIILPRQVLLWGKNVVCDFGPYSSRAVRSKITVQHTRYDRTDAEV